MHFWADQTKAMIGGENSQTRSPGSTGEGNWPRFVGNWFAPPSTQDFLGKVGLNIALAWLLPVAVVKQHDGDLHAVGWGEGPWALVTPVKAIRVGEGFF